MLSDQEGKVVEAFGVVKFRPNMCGRQSFLVNKGEVIWNDLKAGTANHAEDVMKALDELLDSPPEAGDSGSKATKK